MKKVSLKKSHNKIQSANDSANQTLKQEKVVAFIPYNSKWGMSQKLGEVPVGISLDQKCIIELNKITSYLNTSMCKCLGQNKVKESTAKYVTFDVSYNEESDCYIIDEDSYQLYYGNIAQLGKLQVCSVFLKVNFFISPEGQPWVNEKSYENYASNMSAIYECSDGSLVNNYNEFKTWEKELALRPNNPNYNVLPANKSLEDIEHVTVNSDGTIWRDATILSEYLAWRRNRNHNYRDGYYCGVYGIANSFKEYVKLYNTSYFTVQGLKRSEQHLDPTYHFLFINQSFADMYIERLKSFQKRK